MITELYLIAVIIIGLVILSPEHSFLSIMEAAVTLAVWLSLYFIQTKWIIPKYLKEKKLCNYIGLSVLALLLSILLLIPVNLFSLEEMLYRRYYVAIPKLDYLLDINKWNVFRESITFLLTVFCGTVFYGFIRNMKFPDKKFYIKILPTGFSIIVIVLISLCFIFVLIEKNTERPVPDYKTETNNNQIKIIEQTEAMLNLSDILNQSDNKLTCITLWTPSCGAQIYQIEQINKLRIELKNENIQFIYLCGDYENSRDIWTDFIIREDIEGIHYYLSREQFHRILIEELNINTGIIAVRTILFDAEHRILSKDFPLLKNKQKLIEQ